MIQPELDEDSEEMDSQSEDESENREAIEDLKDLLRAATMMYYGIKSVARKLGKKI